MLWSRLGSQPPTCRYKTWPCGRQMKSSNALKFWLQLSGQIKRSFGQGKGLALFQRCKYIITFFRWKIFAKTNIYPIKGELRQISELYLGWTGCPSSSIRTSCCMGSLLRIFDDNQFREKKSAVNPLACLAPNILSKAIYLIWNGSFNAIWRAVVSGDTECDRKALMSSGSSQVFAQYS